MDFDFESVEGFEWDEGNAAHAEKHGISARECEEIFSNKPRILKRDEKHSQDEDRFEILGRTDEDKKIFVVYTVRNGMLRIISARNQNKKERRQYEKIKKDSSS